MTKKHFISMAITFAQIRMSIESSNYGDAQKANQLIGLQAAIDGFCQVAKQHNSNFDASYFKDFILEIWMGERDLNGKKIKQTKKAA